MLSEKWKVKRKPLTNKTTNIFCQDMETENCVRTKRTELLAKGSLVHYQRCYIIIIIIVVKIISLGEDTSRTVFVAKDAAVKNVNCTWLISLGLSDRF